MSVENGDTNGDYYYMNSFNGSIINNHNSIEYKNKRDEIAPNRHLRENNGLPDGVDIDDILPASVLNQCVNIKYNNKYCKFQINSNIPTSNYSSVPTLTSPSVTSKNYEVCSLFNPIHKKIKYSYSFKLNQDLVGVQVIQ